MRNISKSLNPKNMDIRVSDIRIRNRSSLKAVFGYPHPVANTLFCRISNRQTE